MLLQQVVTVIDHLAGYILLECDIEYNEVDLFRGIVQEAVGIARGAWDRIAGTDRDVAAVDTNDP